MNVHIAPPLPFFMEALNRHPFKVEESEQDFYTGFEFWGTPGTRTVYEEATTIAPLLQCPCGCGRAKSFTRLHGNCASAEYSLQFWCGAEGTLYLEEYGREYTISCSVKLV